MSWLGKLNKYVLQWGCVRLAKVVDTDGINKDKITGWKIIYPICPTSGWNDSYRYLWGDKMRSVDLWKKK
jgi:hypothetical protein